MDIIRAREIVRILADGIDPTTGEVLSSDNVYNSPDVIRALFTLLEATDANRTEAPLKNAGKPWNTSEDEKLRKEFSSKIKISDIAKAHGRTTGAIESRLSYLGLKVKPFWLFKKKSTYD